MNNFFKIPKKYQQWSQIFKNNETKTVLPQHKSWLYKILLKLNTKLTFEFILFLFEKKLKIIQNYLQINLNKQLIYFFMSPASYLIIFVEKNGK